MADLSKDEVQSLGRAVGLDIAEPLLTEVTYNLNALRELDQVAYMRFASVYKDFQDPADFERELEDLGSLRKTTPPKPRSSARAT